MWKTIFYNGNETDYEVSEKGTVRNKKTKYVLKGNVKPTGYIEFNIKPYYALGHRLVAEAFLENPFGLD